MKPARTPPDRSTASPNIPGPKSQKLCAAEREFIAPGLQRIALLSEIALVEGRGCRVTDADGNEFLDFFAGVAVASLGHSHPRFVRDVSAQLQRLSVGSFTTETRIALLELLAELAPGKLRRTQLYSGGAEAVEAALRLAKAYTGKFEVVGFWGGFHGKTGGVMGLIGDPWKQKWGPLSVGTHLVPYADCYRCPFKATYPDCGMLCLEFARDSIRNNTAGSIAAIVVEPMQGTAGNIIPPPEFLPGVAEIAKENDALLIADEMITGFGRTGEMFGCEHTGVEPDIMTIGKGFGSGFPISGLISTDDITSAMPFAKASSSSSSYGGNPLAATAARATVTAIVEDNLAANARRVGNAMIDALRELQERHPVIGDVRGEGLLIGVDLVANRETREPLGKEATEFVFLQALRRGLLLMGYVPRIRIHPPLVLSEAEALEGVAVLDEALSDAARAGMLPT